MGRKRGHMHVSERGPLEVKLIILALEWTIEKSAVNGRSTMVGL